MLFVAAHIDEADEAVDEIEALGVVAVKFPAMEVLPGETAVSPELLTERLALLRRLADGTPPAVIVAPIHALMQAVPPASDLERMMRVLRVGDRVVIEDLAAWLTERGYSRVETIESPGEFAVRGGIVDVYLPGGSAARIDLFGDEIEGLFDVDIETMGSDRRLDRVEIVGMSAEAIPTGHSGEMLRHNWPARRWRCWARWSRSTSRIAVTSTARPTHAGYGRSPRCSRR